jgi:shikimate dehydrogenase
MEQAQQLASSFSDYEVSIVDYSCISLSTFQLLVNTTPIGMAPDTTQSPLPEDIALPNNLLIYDLVYSPRETKLVWEARARKLHATTGLGMLIEQAVLAFELWTGHTLPRDTLWNAVEN